MEHTGEAQATRPAALTRRTLLGTAAAGATLAGCSLLGPAKPAPPRLLSAQTVLLLWLIGGKEHLITLYQRAAVHPELATALEPFRQRHLAHLEALRALLPSDVATRRASPPPTNSPATSAPTPTPAPPVSLAELRTAERRAAAERPAQTGMVPPALAQLLASIGACEAVHVIALGKLGE